ncbi:MAG: DJ-1/PfpI family protein [Deltaproteobacteria bacterium]|nr:DJ-1/PfpI family protein [Deltaproteobacteria bacterium]
MNRVLVILAPGFEEVEAFGPVDMLRRAGADVTTAGTVDGVIVGRNDIKVLADESLDHAMNDEFDMIILPGGSGGTENMMNDERVRRIIEHHDEEGKYITAICAAPTVLANIGITRGKTITSHPSVMNQFRHETYSEDRVVIDGNIITSRGPGTALEFGLKLVEILVSREKAEEVNSGVMAKL